MECEFTERVSALLDGELDEREAQSLREHLSVCATCQEAEREFLILRREIQSYRSGASQNEEARQALVRLLGAEHVPFWKRRVALPVPALALLVLAVLAPGVWIIEARKAARRTEPEAAREEKRVAPLPPAASTDSAVDLARFDYGGRLVIYKVRLDNAANKGQ